MSAYDSQGAYGDAYGINPDSSNRNNQAAWDGYIRDDPGPKPDIEQGRDFDDDHKFPGGGISEMKGGQSKIMFDVSAGQSTKHLSREERLAEIQRREKLALDIERQLNDKEKEVAKAWMKRKGAPNWPFPCWAFARHNIEEDIPEEKRWNVRVMYALWITNALALFWNWLCMTMWWFWPEDSPSNISNHALWAGVCLLLGVPFTWRWWYKRYYKIEAGVRTMGMTHFFGSGMVFLYACIMAIGLEILGAAGVLSCLKVLIHQPELGICFLVATILWAVVVVGSMYMFKRHMVEHSLEYQKEIIRKAGRDIVKEAAISTL